MSYFPRALQEGEQDTTKEMPVSDPLKSEKSAGICHEELDILSTQEEMFPENNVTGNDRQIEQECPSQRTS